MSEKIPLLEKKQSFEVSGLSVVFATLCIVDLFGVFPIVALPKAIVECGWIGFPLALSVLGLQVYTAKLLGRCWLMAEQMDPKIITKNRNPYAALAEMTFGKSTRYLVTFLLDTAVFGGSVPNLLVASQNLQILGTKLTEHNVNFSYCYWMLILGVCLCPIMWLGSPKDLKWLALSSVSTVLLVSFLTWKSLLKDIPTEPAHIPSPSWENIAIAYGIIAFQFDIHPVILTIQMDMLDKKKLGHALFSAFCVTGILSMVTTLICFFTYGSRLRYNLLQSLPASNIVYLDVLLVTLQICLSMVVSGTALFQDVEDKLGISEKFTWRRCLARSGLLLLAVLIGESVPRFDLVMGLIGGALLGPLTLILPPLFYARLRSMQPQPEFLCTSYQNNDQLTVLDMTRTVDEYEQWWSADEMKSDNEIKRNLFDKAPEFPVKTMEQSSLGGLILFRDRISDVVCLDSYPAIGPMTFWERVVTLVIVVLGITATVLATYYTVINTVRNYAFVPPCIVNISIASTLVDYLD